jgi:hypothetical protein
MRVRDLKAALAALPPEYDDSMVVTNRPGLSGPGEATRLITVPTLKGVCSRYSFEEFDRVVWISDGGSLVSKEAEDEGWLVPYVNLTETPPSHTLDRGGNRVPYVPKETT